MKKKGKRRSKSTPSIASTADRHHLYELSVQCAEAEIDFVDETFRKLKKRRAKLLREDFCGTANVCCEWVKRGDKREAIGVDLDPEVLDWGRKNNLSKLTKKQRQRITLLEKNVLNVKTAKPDIISAMNFSYWLLKERQNLKQYFKSVHSSLQDDGIFFLDCYGGYDSHKEIVEEREIDDDGDGFTYIWEQTSFNPIDHELHCTISFAFPDGSEMNKAFSYEWRLWSLPEVRELLEECGFSRVTVYWQGWDKDGEPDGDFKPAKRADADAGWIAYLTAEK
ncbi:class I SAM-dependent methyltransferase [Thiosocius teredinicola]|uniref:class I SAM-dependent methyltransferase n=1 Tax=Thiosocius teredinicola TaxID=1973002 RepID=UPI0009912001